MGYLVSDSLDHTPERCTVVATYKRLVVGIAILSSPRETYITYLAVKAGWNNAGIARYASFMGKPDSNFASSCFRQCADLEIDLCCIISSC